MDKPIAPANVEVRDGSFRAREAKERKKRRRKAKRDRLLSQSETTHGEVEPLTLRNEPTQTRELTTRTFQVRAESINEDNRSVEAVIATETPVTVYDYRTGRLVDEVLRMDGGIVPDQTPMLDNHNRWSIDDVYGSAREFKSEERELTGRLYFDEGDPSEAGQRIERAWNKVRRRHVRDVSAGYRVTEWTDIPVGETRVVNGRRYTARGRTLRISTRWQLKEVSLTPIGADSGTKIRGDYPLEQTMKPELRTYLESIGLRKEADDNEAGAFFDGLKDDQRTRADEIKAGTRSDPPPARPADSPNPRPTPRSRTDIDIDSVDPAAARVIADRAVADDRARRTSLRELAGDDVPDDVRQRAEDEGTSVADAAPLFLTAVRAGRQPDSGAFNRQDNFIPAGTPGNRVGVPSGNARALAAGMLESFGVSDPTTHSMHNGRRNPGRADRLTEQDAEQGERFRNLSAMDLVRASLYADTGRRIDDREEAMAMSRAAMSGSTLSYVFTTNVYAKLLAGWAETPDTTGPWCDEEDVPNFLTQEDISLEAEARLRVLSRGDTAKHATMSDSRETYRAKRFARQFVVDEQDVIDDRLNAIMRMPQEMGQAARSHRAEMVYSAMLENPTMEDTGAVFNSTAVTTDGGHANLGAAVLGSAGLKAAITSMSSQRLGRTETDPGRVLNIRPKYLIIPAALDWTARELTAPAALAKLFADSDDPLFTTENLLARENLTVVLDDRVGAVGVMDPTTEAARTGSATNWWLFEGGNRGLRVLYRRGTGRLPQLRSFTLDRGQWGQGWDINLDIGVAFTEWRTVYKSTGTG